MSKLEKELLEVTCLDKIPREPRQKFLGRLVQSVFKLPDDDWDSLSTEAQKWYNDAAEAKKAQRDIQDFPDDEDEVIERAPPMAPEPEHEPEVLRARGRSLKTMTPAEPEELKNEKFVKKVTNGRGRPRQRRASACHTIKLLVVKKPSISVKEISAKLAKSDYTVTDLTISSLRSDTRDTLRVLNELGIGDFEL